MFNNNSKTPYYRFFLNLKKSKFKGILKVSAEKCIRIDAIKEK